MRCTTALKAAALGMLGATALATALCAQEGAARNASWRGGSTISVGAMSGISA